ncbi:MAG: hypothetical protein OXG02_06775 [Chloroflexi bacterium]|nr:hypothetical protein [Anaerolineaceae bacterium]MCY4106392.1 hypothetical protein [Chloroflexota bacterium]
MQVKLFLLADFANRDAAGKENILGVFSRINSPSFPYTHEAMYLVIRLVAELGEMADKRRLRVVFCDEDGAELANMEADFEVPLSEQGIRPEMSFILILRELELTKPGSYEFRLYIEKDRKATLPLEVRPIHEQRP